MAKTRQRPLRTGTAAAPRGAARTTARTPAGQRRGAPRQGKGGRAAPRRRAELVGIALVILGVLAFAGWWILTTRSADDTGTGGADVGSGAIARLTAPDIHSLVIDPRDPDHVLFGSHAGIQESQDGGYTWEDGTLENADAMIMAVSPNDSETFYVAGHNVFLASRDGGESWQPVQHDLPGTDIHAFAQDTDDPRRLYAFVVGAGVYASADGGATWSALAAQPPGGQPLALSASGGVLYAAIGDGVAASRDGGASWQPLPAQPPGGATSLVVSAANPQVVYAGSSAGLAKSADGGATWTVVGPEGATPLALAVAPTDPNRVLFVDPAGAVYRSDDGGATWRTR